MAKPKNNSEQTTVTRITASDDKKVAKKRPALARKKKAHAIVIDGDQKQNGFMRFLGYFKGAWFELRQVRWPNRRATWSMTAALLIFTALFVGFILAVDLLWEYLFKLILG